MKEFEIWFKKSYNKYWKNICCVISFKTIESSVKTKNSF
jgi:hypothetical protein